MSTQYPILDNRPINKWKVAELKEELKRRKLMTKGLKDELVKRLDEAICKERETLEVEASKGFDYDPEPIVKFEDAGEKAHYDKRVEDTRNHDENKTGKVEDVAAVGEIGDVPTDCSQGKDQEEVGDVATVGDNDDGPVDLGRGKVQEDETMGGTGIDEVAGEPAVLEDDVATLGDNDDGPIDLVQGKVQEDETMGGTGIDEVAGEPAVLEDDVATVGDNDDGPIDLGQGKVQEDETMGGTGIEEVVGEPAVLEDDVATVGDNDDGPIDLGQGKVQEDETMGGTGIDKVVGEPAILEDDIATVGDNDDGPIDLGQGKVQEEQTMDGSGIDEVVGEPAVLEVSVETHSTVNETMVTQIALSKEALEDNKIKMETEDSKPAQMDAALDVFNPNNQVFEVSPVLGFQVKSESISTDFVSINEKNELKDNLNSDNVHLELDVVRPEMMQPSSSGDSPNGGDVYPLDGQNPCENQGSVEKTYDNKSTHVDSSKENDSGDGESSVKLNHYSADDYVKEDVLENNQIDSNHNSNEVGDKIDITEVPVIKDECTVAAVEPDLSPEDMETSAEKNTIAAYTEERNLEDDNKSMQVDFSKKSDTADGGFSEKLNLDHSPADDFMEEDALETKQIDSNHNSSEVGHEIRLTEVPGVKVEGIVDTIGPDYSSVKIESSFGKKDNDAAPSAKRKFQDGGVGINETPKRQRRWNFDSLKVPEPQISNVKPATTPKDSHQTTKVEHNFNRSDSTLGGDTPKERIVPPSPKPPTSSLRIDRFLRPFTLKAVQELLAKTGNVCSFWMDQIKTHCYVTYSSVEEAIETRNAVYNLRWPQNGGRLLVAEFVDPQEVKLRVEVPPQSPAAPVSTTPTAPVAPPPIQLPPSTRQHSLRQQPPPPPPPLPQQMPPVSDPPTRRERHPLPPPQPTPEKLDPPIVTLDDLFRKTRATPRIYYLPLTEEQAAAKLATQGKKARQ